MKTISQSAVNFRAEKIADPVPFGVLAGLALGPAPGEDVGVREEADLDSLVTRIQSDLRAGRGPRDTQVREREIHLRSELRILRGRRPKRVAIAHLAARWAVPALIFAVVSIAVLLSDRL